MWLLLTAAAALAATVVWYKWKASDRYRLGFLCLIYWGATLMWLVDHIVSFWEQGGPFLEISWKGTALGAGVLGLGLVAWLIRLFLANPRVAPRSARR